MAERGYLRLVLLGAAIGIPAALVAAVFLAVVHELEDWLWPDDAQWYRVVGLPVVGAAVVLAARKLLPGDGGHPPLEGIGGGVTPLSHAPGIALAALGTLAFGAVLGPEAPLIALGSVAGVAAAKLARLGPKETAVLATAGSFSAISALFGGPLVAGMLLVEGSLGLGHGGAADAAARPGGGGDRLRVVRRARRLGRSGSDRRWRSRAFLPTTGPTSSTSCSRWSSGSPPRYWWPPSGEAATRVDAQQRVRMPVVLLGGGLAVGLLALLTDALGGNGTRRCSPASRRCPSSSPRARSGSCCSC